MRIMLFNMCSQPNSEMPSAVLTWKPVFRLRRSWALLLVVVLVSNAMFMMVSQVHASAIGETVFVEVIDDETMVVNCAGIHCNLFFEASIDFLPNDLKDNLKFNFTIGVADFIFSPLKKPPRPLTV